MIKLDNQDVETELRAYCQSWLSYLSEGKWEKACKLVSVPNNYGVSWCMEEIVESMVDYFSGETEFKIQNTDISECSPEMLKCNDGSFLFGFYFPINGQITDLTVEFEFSPIENKEYNATINYIHVL